MSMDGTPGRFSRVSLGGLTNVGQLQSAFSSAKTLLKGLSPVAYRLSNTA